MIVDKDLVARLERASEAQLRATALAACCFAVERTGLNDPIIDKGLKALKIGRYNDSSLRARLDERVYELDVIQWNLQEKMEQGHADKATWILAFNQARAANSVCSAFDLDSSIAATNSVYEAYHATDDLAGLKLVLLAVLDRKQQ